LIYHLCLGSNQADRKKNILAALDSIEKENIKINKASSLYETEPVDIRKQSFFFNMVIEIECQFGPQELLRILKHIEYRLGRIKTFPKGPRKIDIDILLAEDFVISSPNLKIPHQRMDKRNFVLVPLSEITPDAIHPVLKKSVKTLAQETDDLSTVIRIERTLWK
jgi:2-amino-4-hydroxy-6-hydroxymethyldihydropteridine diphosphokinase